MTRRLRNESASQREFDFLKERLKAATSTLPPREQKLLMMRFGLEDVPLTVYEVSLYFNCPESTIRRIENKALRRLRHPSRTQPATA